MFICLCLSPALKLKSGWKENNISGPNLLVELSLFLNKFCLILQTFTEHLVTYNMQDTGPDTTNPHLNKKDDGFCNLGELPTILSLPELQEMFPWVPIWVLGGLTLV